MPKRSAGVLLHRIGSEGTEVLLVHPGGPFWRSKDVGAWQIPKGEIEPGEDAESAVRNEAQEEFGVAIDVPLVPLGEIRQADGKLVTAFAAAMDVDPDAIVSDTTEIEGPRGSGRRMANPEIDAAKWLTLAEARRLMHPSQTVLLHAGVLVSRGLINAPRFSGARLPVVARTCWLRSSLPRNVEPSRDTV